VMAPLIEWLALKHIEDVYSGLLERLTPDTAYLQGELETQLHSVRVLLVKIEREQHLRQDRDAVLSMFHRPSDGLSEWLAVHSEG
jgi:hypothetical protein